MSVAPNILHTGIATTGKETVEHTLVGYKLPSCRSMKDRRRLVETQRAAVYSAVKTRPACPREPSMQGTCRYCIRWPSHSNSSSRLWGGKRTTTRRQHQWRSHRTMRMTTAGVRIASMPSVCLEPSPLAFLQVKPSRNWLVFPNLQDDASTSCLWPRRKKRKS